MLMLSAVIRFLWALNIFHLSNSRLNQRGLASSVFSRDDSSVSLILQLSFSIPLWILLLAYARLLSRYQCSAFTKQQNNFVFFSVQTCWCPIQQWLRSLLNSKLQYGNTFDFFLVFFHISALKLTHQTLLVPSVLWGPFQVHSLPLQQIAWKCLALSVDFGSSAVIFSPGDCRYWTKWVPTVLPA